MGPVNPVVNRNLGVPGNDARHDKPDFNKGGGPTPRNRKKIAPVARGGTGHPGQKVVMRAPLGGGRGSAGNPAGRGSVTPVGRQSFPSETRNAGHGGSAQVRKNMTADASSRGTGFGRTGQEGVPTAATNPKPGAGNTAGRMAKRITGRFNQASKGPRARTAGLSGGKWGGPPVRLDT